MSLFGGVARAGDVTTGGKAFTQKAYLIRYWKRQISNDLPKPWFLLNKASPLSAVQSATFSELAAQKELSTHLPFFCSSSNLICFPNLSSSLEKHNKDANFTTYLNKNFTDYGTGHSGGADSFKNYSTGDNPPIDSFRRYIRGSVSHWDKFSNYAPNAVIPNQSFTTYGTAATGGTGEFKNYNNLVIRSIVSSCHEGPNVPQIRI